jgi:multiple antibiotic resistance protein
MQDISYVELFITLFIGMGPIKVLLIYMAMTEGMEATVRRRIALRTVLVAGAVGIVLLIFGALFQAVLHFSIGALTITGGLILLILALTMVLGGQKASPEGHEKKDPMSMAISPLAIPLTLNPVGIVTLVIASAEMQKPAEAAVIAAMIVGIMVINLGVLSLSGRLAKVLSHEIVELMERVLGILLGALAVELILTGLSGLGIITMSSGH